MFMSPACFDGPTSTVGSVHDFFSGALGLFILGAIGTCGLFAVYVALRDSGRTRAIATAAVAIALGVLLTATTEHVSTTMACWPMDNDEGGGPQGLERWGAPAYFEITVYDADGSMALRLPLVADAVFWSGVAGALIAIVALRRGRRALRGDAEGPRATATLGRRSRPQRPPTSTGT
jgi:hypothetical protein